MINPATFKEDYHNPALNSAEVARRHGLRVFELPYTARILGLKTRTQLGIKGKQPRIKRLGSHGCNSGCPEWQNCCKNGGRGPLPCEIYFFSDENMALIDTEPVYRRDSDQTT